MRFAMVFVLTAALAVLASPALALTLNVDSGPNASGSPLWAPWWTATKADIVAGTFADMRSAVYPGTLIMSPYDEIVYSTGDLGKRLLWIYSVPGLSPTQLAGNFQVKISMNWEGYNYALDFSTGGWMNDGPNVGWVSPASWEPYNGGTIGAFGLGWWATDNDALPYSTNANPYDETNQADIDAWAALLQPSQLSSTGLVRIRDNANSPWTVQELQVDMIPEPLTMAGLFLGLAGVGGYIRKRRRA